MGSGKPLKFGAPWVFECAKSHCPHPLTFAAAASEPLESLGVYPLRGIAKAQETLALPMSLKID
jgi:hypothetical protein